MLGAYPIFIMSEKPSPSGPPKKKVGVEPRALPDRQEDSGNVPFEQLNDVAPDTEPKAPRSVIQPRNLPAHEEETILEAARLLHEGKTHEEVANRLKIEPLKLRRWEKAYSAEFQRDLNEGDYHDTDAQLRELSDDSKEKFQGNWEQVTEKATERRVKIGPVKEKLMSMAVTRWLFRNEHGALDYGVIGGIIVALVGLSVALNYMRHAGENPVNQKDDSVALLGLDDLTRVKHDPKAAADVIIGFLRTRTWEEKLPYVSHPETVRPLMKEWYEKHPEEVYAERITFGMDEPLEVGDRNFFQVGLTVGNDDASRIDDRHVIVAVELMPNGEYKIDWETSSGYQEMIYEELTTQMPTEPVELRLTLEAADYYNFGFNDDEYVAFRATYLGNPNAIFLYGRKDDPVARKLADKLDILDMTGAIVKVRYPKDAKAADQLELVEVVAETWFRDYEASGD